VGYLPGPAPRPLLPEDQLSPLRPVKLSEVRSLNCPESLPEVFEGPSQRLRVRAPALRRSHRHAPTPARRASARCLSRKSKAPFRRSIQSSGKLAAWRDFFNPTAAGSNAWKEDGLTHQLRHQQSLQSRTPTRDSPSPFILPARIGPAPHADPTILSHSRLGVRATASFSYLF